MNLVQIKKNKKSKQNNHGEEPHVYPEDFTGAYVFVGLFAPGFSLAFRSAVMMKKAEPNTNHEAELHAMVTKDLLRDRDDHAAKKNYDRCMKYKEITRHNVSDTSASRRARFEATVW